MCNTAYFVDVWDVEWVCRNNKIRQGEYQVKTPLTKKFFVGLLPYSYREDGGSKNGESNCGIICILWIVLEPSASEKR